MPPPTHTHIQKHTQTSCCNQNSPALKNSNTLEPKKVLILYFFNVAQPLTTAISTLGFLKKSNTVEPKKVLILYFFNVAQPLTTAASTLGFRQIFYQTAHTVWPVTVGPSSPDALNVLSSRYRSALDLEDSSTILERKSALSLSGCMWAWEGRLWTRQTFNSGNCSSLKVFVQKASRWAKLGEKKKTIEWQ